MQLQILTIFFSVAHFKKKIFLSKILASLFNKPDRCNKSKDLKNAIKCGYLDQLQLLQDESKCSDSKRDRAFWRISGPFVFAQNIFFFFFFFAQNIFFLVLLCASSLLSLVGCTLILNIFATEQEQIFIDPTTMMSSRILKLSPVYPVFHTLESARLPFFQKRDKHPVQI